MKTIEVKSSDWKKLCDHINEGLPGAFTTIQQLLPDGRAENVIEQLPLQNIAFDEQSDGCNNLLVFETGSEKPVRHVIIEPIHILLHRGDNDRFNRLEVHSETGRTVVSFHPGLKSFAAT